ncbi:NADH:flavin oxidoreductase/NADH oxidase family protein [Ferruginivarius sediminum]|uniref:NADH:flavin oxidoreductase n=1 Tax=Ferruginivarius sediminum TaxID=2661937 RepID=A0A369T927_9PROT|nr:NADH:flavin oxidoreductase/NADH oxidase family protein [Ferruginivarius sediminum]RDD60875.1 NADH:flavin oxidoreductase [Ferruginivarius sediminum]
MSEAEAFASPLELPCGAVIKNRIVKPAMSDGLGDGAGGATQAQERLYRRWAHGGAGLVLIGEVQVDHRYPERPGNLALDRIQSPAAMTALRRMTAAGTENGTHFWAQLGHAGALTYGGVNDRPAAPSAVEVRGNHAREMSEDGIAETVAGFARAAATAREGGFTGVEIHAAHGFLLSQFLSPRFNRRTDGWGGSLVNRARMLMEVIRAVRAAVGQAFPVGVKLNSADFSKGGFSMEESRQVTGWLNEEAIDLLEISGGTYESDESGASELKSESTRAREAFFLDYADSIRDVFHKPVLVTGGLRTRAGLVQALQSGSADLVGMARPLAVEPDLPSRLIARQAEGALRVEGGFPAQMPPGAGTAWYGVQLMRLGDGLEPDLTLDPTRALQIYDDLDRRKAADYRLCEAC